MINKKRFLKLFCDLVTIDSPSQHEERVAKFVLARLKKLGLKARKDRFHNIIATLPGTKPGYLMLSAHLDTVEPGRGVEPLVTAQKVCSRGDTILGADNKVGVAGIMEALQVIREKKIATPSLEIVFTVCEEVGGHGACQINFRGLKSKRGYNFDSEDTLGRIITCSPTYIRVDAIIKGKSAHSSTPRQGKNVLQPLTYILNNLPLGQVDKLSTINLGIVKTGQVRNAIPAKLEIQGEIRSQDHQLARKWQKKVRSIFQQAAKRYKQTARLEIVPEIPGFVISHRDPFLQQTKKVLRKMKINSQLEKIMGCADTNIFRKNGVEMINLSNGGHKAHTTDEYIPLKDFYRLGEMIVNLMKSA